MAHHPFSVISGMNINSQIIHNEPIDLWKLPDTTTRVIRKSIYVPDKDEFHTIKFFQMAKTDKMIDWLEKKKYKKGYMKDWWITGTHCIMGEDPYLIWALVK